MKITPSIIYKINVNCPPTVVLDLQDNCSIVIGDEQGEISVWEYQK